MECFASSVPTNFPSPDQNKRRELSVSALQTIQKFKDKGDPVSVLNQHYQKNGITNITNRFAYAKFEQRERKQYWKCSFQCPLDEQIIKSSILALPLFHPNPPSELTELSEKTFGEHIVVDGEVYFDKKKFAKKSVAFAMLLHFFSSGIPGKYDTTQKVKASKEKGISKVKMPPPSQKTLNRLRTKNIKWVNELYKAGVREVSISYQEYRSPKECRSSWRGQQSQIQCLMKTDEPVELEVISSYKTSRNEARYDAVAKITKQLISIQDQSAGALTCVVQNEESSTKVLIEKQKIVECDTPLCNYLFLPPHWASNELLLKECDDNSKDFLLFEIALSSAKRGSSPFRIPHKQTTRIGVLLPSCEELTTKDSFEAPFRFDPDGKEFVVMLKNRQLLKADATTQWHLLEKLNQINWKSYGTAQSQNSAAKSTRNYIFVPLLLHEGMKIDWKLVQTIVSDSTSPYLMTSRNLKCSLLWAATGTLVSYIAFRKIGVTLAGENSVLAIFFLATFLVHACFFPEYNYRVADEACNSFLKHKTGKRNSLLYLPSSPKNIVLDANSSFLSPHNREFMGHETRYGLDMSRATFRDYFRARYGVRIKHPRQKLLSAYRIKSMSAFQNCKEEHFSEQAFINNVYLIPEMIEVLPMPCDYLSTVRFAHCFMPSLERAINICSFANTLEEMTERTQPFLTNELTVDSCRDKNSYPIAHDNRTLCKLLADATTTFPIKCYERLEFLGDSVLNYLVFLNLFENNFATEWDHDDLGELAQAAYKNTALIDGALRAGLNRLLHTCIIRWTKGNKAGRFTSNCEQQRSLIAGKTLSDVAESVLAAAYLYRNIKYENGQMVVGFLKLLDLPLSKGASWLLAQGGCIAHGYSFEHDKNWGRKLQEIDSIFSAAKISDRLESHRRALMSIIEFRTMSGENLRKCLEEGSPKLLFRVALFDSSLDGSDGALVGNSLEHAALLRDSLYHVGHSSLSLVLSEQLYQLHPDATPGDLTLLRACMLADDVLVYIMVTWGMHKCLFDNLDSCGAKFEQYMLVANNIGRGNWDDNDGWILPGGEKEYHRRIKSAFPRHSYDDNALGPAYPGLAGGRLYGQKKKINKATTENLMFSFKCIVGAMTLSLGTNGMWHILRPLFEEIMVIGPDEYRTKFPDSFCSSYAQGKTNCLPNAQP